MFVRSDDDTAQNELKRLMQSDFDAAYSAVCSKDVSAIKSLIDNISSSFNKLNFLVNDEGHSLIQKLILNGKLAEVDYLISFTDDDTYIEGLDPPFPQRLLLHSELYRSCLEDAAYSCASVANTAGVKHYVDMGVRTTHLPEIYAAYIKAGRPDLAKLSSNLLSQENVLKYLAHAIYEYALIGDEVNVEKYLDSLNKYATDEFYINMPFFMVTAMQGYIEGGFKHLAERHEVRFLSHMPDPDGYFDVPHYDALTKLLVMSYAKNGYLDDANRLCKRWPFLIESALTAFAAGGFVDVINNYFDSGYIDTYEGLFSDPCLLAVLKGYAEGGYLRDSESRRLLLSYTSNCGALNFNLRERLVMESQVGGNNIRLDEIVSREARLLTDQDFNCANLIESLMREYNLNYHQLKAFLTSNVSRKEDGFANNSNGGVRVWLLQGMQLVTGHDVNRADTGNALPILPLDVFLHISSIVVGLPVIDTMAILNGVHKKLFADMNSNLVGKNQSCLFTRKKHIKEREKIESRYYARLG